VEDDVLEAVERSWAAFNSHTENCALPRSQEEFGEVHRIECRIDLTCGLSRGDAGGERSAPFLEDRFQSLAQEIALRGGLKTEIADQATAIPIGVCQHAADDVQIPLESLPGSEGFVVQSYFDIPLEVRKVAIEYFFGERLFGMEVIG
jgi:hypothetical protein